MKKTSPQAIRRPDELRHKRAAFEAIPKQRSEIAESASRARFAKPRSRDSRKTEARRTPTFPYSGRVLSLFRPIVKQRELTESYRSRMTVPAAYGLN